MTQANDITRLLADWQSGDADAKEQLTAIVYEELRVMARRYMAAESGNVTLQPTVLVHEAFLRLSQGEIDFKSRKHFYVIAARMMRRVLVDHARARNSDKRGGGSANVTLAEDRLGGGESGDEIIAILALDRALTQLSAKDAQLSAAVELVFFGGLSADEAADLQGTSRTAMFEDLRFAKAWLRNAMG